METKIRTEKVCLKKEKLSANIEQIVENDMSLADYYGDIVKILGNTVTVNVFSAVITGDKAVVEGSVRIRVMYADNEGKSEIFETDCPFSRSIDVRGASADDRVNVAVNSEQVTCKAVNPRRAEIRGSVSLKVSVSAMEECEIVSADSADFCHVLPCKADGYFLAAGASKSCTLTQSADIDSNIRVSKIYRTDVMTTVNEVRTIRNKMMFKGAAVLDVVMLDSDGNFVSQRMNIPVNQIADIEGIDEGCNCLVTLAAGSADVRLIADTPQSPAHIEAALIVNADIDAYRKMSLNAVSEAYSPVCEIICEKQNIKCTGDIVRVNETHTVRSEIDFSSCKAAVITDVAVRKIRYTAQPSENTMVVKGNIHFGIVVADNNNDKLYFERISDFEYKKQFGEDVSECDFVPDISVNAINCSLNENSQAVISTELRINGFMNVCRQLNIVTAIEKGQMKDRAEDDGIITVYFASKGERIWDIARQQGSSPELIRQLNELDEDILSTDRMLVFELE